MLAVVYVLCFGKPKPMHKVVVGNWQKCRQIHFVCLTDCVDSWKQLEGENLTFVNVTIEEFFKRASEVLDIDLNLYRHSHFFGVFNGWSACGLRHLLADMFPVFCRSVELWGFMDYDVLINCGKLDEHLERNQYLVLLLFPSCTCVWEHLKIHRKSIDMKQLWIQAADWHDGHCPMEVALSYHLRSLYPCGDIQQNEVVSHWKYSDDALSGFNRAVLLTSAQKLVDLKNNTDCMFFIADTEVKENGDCEVDEINVSMSQGDGFTFYERFAKV